MFKWIKKLFTPKKQTVEVLKKVKKEIEKAPCWKHLKFKKGCILCRNMNGS